MTKLQNDVNRVVAAVDLTETGDSALREAMRLCRLAGTSELHVVHVIESGSDVRSAAKIDDLSEQMKKAAKDVRAHVIKVCAPEDDSGEFVQDTVVHIRLGKASEAIHQLCVDVDGDVVVVGTHQRKGLNKLLLGSVAESLVRMARLPVVVAHPKDFTGLDASDRPDAKREGSASDWVSTRETLHFRPRTSHIAGLV
jgi:nucleotide-binding universal stress UspA family protein